MPKKVKLTPAEVKKFSAFIGSVSGGKGAAANAASKLISSAGDTGAASAVANVAKSYFEAEAKKQVSFNQYDAEKVKAAVSVNKDIMHELDRPVLVYQKNTRRSSLRVEPSILSFYMMGVMAEKANNSMADVRAGRAADNFSKDMLLVRAPLGPAKATTAILEGPEAQQLAAQTAAAKAATQAAYSKWREGLPEWMRQFIPSS